MILHLCPSIQALVSYSSFLLYPSPHLHASHFFSNQTDIIQIRMWHIDGQVRLQPWDDGGAKPSPVCWLLYCATEKEAPWNTWRWVSIHLVLLGCSEICHRKPTERLPRSWNWGGKKAFVESVLLFFFAGGWLIIISHPWQLWHAGRQNKKKSQFSLGWVTYPQPFNVTMLKICTHWHLTPPQTTSTTPLSSGKWKGDGLLYIYYQVPTVNVFQLQEGQTWKKLKGVTRFGEPCPKQGPLNLLRERDKGSVVHSIWIQN